MLADAHIIDIGGDAAEFQIQSHPGLGAAGVQGRGHGDHPGVPALEDGLHMGLGDIALRIERQGRGVEGEILVDLLPGLVAQGPAAQEVPGGVVGGDRRHVGADFQEIVEELLPLLGILGGGLEGGLHQGHDAVHIGDVARHGVAHLVHGLTGGGLGAAEDRPAVGVQKQGHGAQHHAQHHPGDYHHQHRGHTQRFRCFIRCLRFCAAPSARRRNTS